MQNTTQTWYNEHIKATAQRQLPVAWPLSIDVGATMLTVPSSAGIYKITCTANHKVYIGSTTEIRKRWGWHRSDLRRGVHHNRHLQFAWNKYGEQSFEFEILEMVMFAEHLHDREQYWLDRYQAYDAGKGFNCGKVARAPWLGRSHSEETKQKLSDAAKANGTADYARTFANEWHGSAAGLSWHSLQGARSWKLRKAADVQCAYCGASFQSKDTKAKYCSEKCRAYARRDSGIDNETRSCAWCGGAFVVNRYAPIECCSRSCSAYWRESKKKP